MSSPVSEIIPLASEKNSAGLPGWRRWMIVVGAGLGLMSGFAGLYFGSLSFFLLPMMTEFGWSRADISLATVLSMLGAAIGAPVAGKLFERFGTERVIAVAVLLFSVGAFSLSRFQGSVAMLGSLSFIVGFASSATTIVGYMTILPRWFDRNLGLALGFAGLGLGLGIALSPTVATILISNFGWRGAYQAMALFALVAGLVAWLLISPRGQTSTRAHKADAAAAGAEGLTLSAALQTWRFWLMVFVIFSTSFGMLGAVIHGASLFSDRGLTPQQAALGAGLAGVGTIAARLVAGALMDRFHAPLVGALFFAFGATGLLLNSSSQSFPILVLGTVLGGVAIGAEGDLMPFLVRRYFGMRAFGAIFGCMFVAYACGGVLGPITYGYVFDHFGSYTPIMLTCSVLCVLAGASLLTLGAYRFRAAEKH